VIVRHFCFLDEAIGGLDSKSVLSDIGGRCAADGWPESAIRVSI
jgi:hypothetical protein